MESIDMGWVQYARLLGWAVRGLAVDWVKFAPGLILVFATPLKVSPACGARPGLS